jgi:hypothetical protein
VESRRKILEAKVSEYLERAEALHKLVAAPQPYPHPHPPVCDPSPRLRRVRVRVVPCPRSSRWLAGVCVCVCVCVPVALRGFRRSVCRPVCATPALTSVAGSLTRRRSWVCVAGVVAVVCVCCGCRRGCVCTSKGGVATADGKEKDGEEKAKLRGALASACLLP